MSPTCAFVGAVFPEVTNILPTAASESLMVTLPLEVPDGITFPIKLVALAVIVLTSVVALIVVAFTVTVTTLVDVFTVVAFTFPEKLALVPAMFAVNVAPERFAFAVRCVVMSS